MTVSRVAARQPHGEFSQFVVEVDGDPVCVVATAYVSKGQGRSATRCPDWRATQVRAEQIADGLRLAIGEPPTMEPGDDVARAAFLERAGLLIGAVLHTLDVAAPPCDGCQRPHYRNWNHYQIAQTLQSIGARLRRFAGKLRGTITTDEKEGD